MRCQRPGVGEHGWRMRGRVNSSEVSLNAVVKDVKTIQSQPCGLLLFNKTINQCLISVKRSGRVVTDKHMLTC